MAATVPSVPASLRQIQHYMKTAAEHDKRDVVVAYYCKKENLWQFCFVCSICNPTAMKALGISGCDSFYFFSDDE